MAILINKWSVWKEISSYAKPIFYISLIATMRKERYFLALRGTVAEFKLTDVFATVP